MEENKVEQNRRSEVAEGAKLENQSLTLNKLATALAKAQSEMAGAKTDSENPYFKSKYADLASVWDACRKPLTDNGLSIVQTTDNENGRVVIITTLLHSSGEWIRGKLAMKPLKEDPQALGSCITYGRRYSLAAIAGISPEDDDAEGAMERGKEKPKPEDAKPSQEEKCFTVKPTTDQLFISKVIKKEDIGKNGKPYTKYTIVDSNGIKYSTFSDTFAKVAIEARNQKAGVRIDSKDPSTPAWPRDLISIEIDTGEANLIPPELQPSTPKEVQNQILALLEGFATGPEEVEAMVVEAIGKLPNAEWDEEDIDRMKAYIKLQEAVKMQKGEKI